MGWLDLSRPPCHLRCVYCEKDGAFPHTKSYEHGGEILSLYACTRCGSLIYDLPDFVPPTELPTDFIGPDAARAARYVLETGFSSHYVTLCALAALPDLPAHELANHLFVDVGAGMGMASYFARTVIGVETVAIEPSYAGRLSQEILGHPVHRAYFEHLPPELLAELARRPCLLHLNSVVEHLVDPLTVLRDIIARARIELTAIIVPDGAALDFNGPFIAALPFLSPRDHLHLPTRLGMEFMLSTLGFAHQAVQQSGTLLIAVGARRPVALPGERIVACAEALLLEQMLRHPHPHVSGGGASRMLPRAVLRRDGPLLAELRRRFPYEAEIDEWLAVIAAGAWDDMPLHLGQSCYWLARDAAASGRADGALALLGVCIAFADAIAHSHPGMAMTPLECKWDSLMLRAGILSARGDYAGARAALQSILDSRADPQNGPRQMHQDRAAHELAELARRTPVPA